MVWFHKPVRALYPTPRDLTGQDEMIVSAWHTPGKELKIETNLPEVQSMRVTSAGPTKKFEFNGKEEGREEQVGRRRVRQDPCPEAEGGKGSQGAQAQEVCFPSRVQALRVQPVGA